MTMIPEKTQYLTQGPDGTRRLKNGPDINTYRGLRIVHSRSFSMEDGAPPRDVLRRRVRVAEYYRIPHEEGIEDKFFSLYDESKDAWQKYSWQDLFSMAYIGDIDDEDGRPERNGRVVFDYDDDEEDDIYNDGGNAYLGKRYKSIPTKLANVRGHKFVDFNITKKGWNKMQAPRNDDMSDPVVSLCRDRTFFLPGKNAPDEKDVLSVMVACGLKSLDAIKTVEGHEDELRGDDAGYLESFRTYRKNFCSQVKSWLIGNLVDRRVHAFLELLNWQGIGEDGALKKDNERLENFHVILKKIFADDGLTIDEFSVIQKDKWELVIIRPNIEHNMLGIVMGRGGLDELGATFWGQTELSCFDDSMHGK
jgi:hypothetical protein